MGKKKKQPAAQPQPATMVTTATPAASSSSSTNVNNNNNDPAAAPNAVPSMQAFFAVQQQAHLAEQNAARGAEATGPISPLPSQRLTRYPAPRLPQQDTTSAAIVTIFLFVVSFDRQRAFLPPSATTNDTNAREFLWQNVAARVPAALRSAFIDWLQARKVEAPEQYASIAPSAAQASARSSPAFVKLLFAFFRVPSTHLSVFFPPRFSVGATFKSYREAFAVARWYQEIDESCLSLADARALVTTWLVPTATSADCPVDDLMQFDATTSEDAPRWAALERIVADLDTATPALLLDTRPAPPTTVNAWSPPPPALNAWSPPAPAVSTTARRPPHCAFCDAYHPWAQCPVVAVLRSAYEATHKGTMPSSGRCHVCLGDHATTQCTEPSVRSALQNKRPDARYPNVSKYARRSKRPYSLEQLAHADSRKVRGVIARRFGGNRPAPSADTDVPGSTLSDPTLSDPKLPETKLPETKPVSNDPINPVFSTTQSNTMHFQPLATSGRVGTHALVVTVDSGANASAIDLRFAQMCNLHIDRSPERLTGPAATTFPSVGRTSFDLTIGSATLPIADAFVVEGLAPQHTLIIGTPLLWGVVDKRLEIRSLPDPASVAIRFGDSGEFVTARFASPPPLPKPTPASSPRFLSVVATPSVSIDEASIERVYYQTIVGGVPTVAVLTGRHLLDDDSVDGLNFDVKVDEVLDSLRDSSFDDPHLFDKAHSVLDAVSTHGASIGVLRSPDLTASPPIGVRERSPTTTTPETSGPVVPDFCDVRVSPGASDDLVRETAKLLANAAHLFGGSRRPGTHQSPPASKCEPFSLTLVPNADLSKLRSHDPKFGPEQQAAIEKQIEAWLPDIVEPSNATFSSRPLAVRKKDGSWRICVDYRRVNAVTLLNQYPLARVDDALSRLARLAVRFSSLDGWSMFQSLLIADELTRDLSSFKACGRLWRFLRCPFGWQSLPSHLQRFMDGVFGSDQRFIPYADDLNVAHPKDTDAALLADLAELLRRSRGAKITWRADKARLFYYAIDTLGHRVAHDAVAPPHDRLDALLNIGKPDSKSDLRRLLRVAQHWSPFLPLFAQIAAPLWDLSHGEGPLVWSDVATSAFEHLLAALRSPTIAVPFDSRRPVLLRTDFSKAAVCWIVLQEHDGVERVVHSGGRRCEPYESRYAPQVGELLALREAVRALPHYLTGLPQPFTWLSDNKPMVDTNASPSDTPSSNATIARWLLELQDVPFRAVHVAGSSPAQSLQDYISRLRAWNVSTPPHAADPRDLPPPTRSASVTRLIDRLVLLDEFTSQPDPLRAALTWLRSTIPATATDALGVFPDPSRTAASFAPLFVSIPANAVALARATMPPSTPSTTTASTTSHPVVPVPFAPPAAPAGVDDTPASPLARDDAPLATLDPSLRSAAWTRSVAADRDLASLRAHADRDKAQRQRAPRAFYDQLGLLRRLTDRERMLAFSHRRRHVNRDNSLIVVPADRREEIFAAYHAGSFGGHFSAATTCRNAQTVFWWPDMRKDFARWYDACPNCTAARARPAQGGAGEVGTNAGKFESISIDCAELPVDVDGYDHIVIIVDHCTRAFEIVPIRGCTAIAVADAFERSWLFRYGCPRLLLSDNGPEFQGDPWARLARQYGFYHTTIAPHNAQANGIVERLIRDIKDRASRIGAADGRNWRRNLDAAAAALRVNIGSRGFSIFELLFGQPPLLPAAARLGVDSHVRRIRATTDDDLYARTNHTVAELIDIVSARRAEQQHAAAMRIRAAAPDAQFNIGDVVSIANLDNRQSKFAALRRWPGPLVIVARAPWSQPGKYEAFQLQRPDGSHVSMFVPARFLKRWHGDPFAAASPAIVAEPGARPWTGILDQSALDQQHLGRSERAAARAAAPPPSSPAESLADAMRADEERFAAAIAARRDDLEVQRDRSERFQQATDDRLARAAELRQRGIDTRFAASAHAFNTQIAIDNLIKHNQPLSTSSSRYEVHSTIPSPHSFKSIFKSIRLDNKVHYIIILNDDSHIITTTSAISQSAIRQFGLDQRAARRGGKM